MLSKRDNTPCHIHKDERDDDVANPADSCADGILAALGDPSSVHSRAHMHSNCTPSNWENDLYVFDSTLTSSRCY